MLMGGKYALENNYMHPLSNIITIINSLFSFERISPSKNVDLVSTAFLCVSLLRAGSAGELLSSSLDFTSDNKMAHQPLIKN